LSLGQREFQYFPGALDCRNAVRLVKPYPVSLTCRNIEPVIQSDTGLVGKRDARMAGNDFELFSMKPEDRAVRKG
jgi:hypothetical protein